MLKEEFKKIKRDKETYERLFQDYYSRWGRIETCYKDLERRYREIINFYENKE